MSQDWDVPNPKLARIAGAELSPFARECPHCKHRHARGEQCGYLTDGAVVTTCRCRQ